MIRSVMLAALMFACCVSFPITAARAQISGNRATRTSTDNDVPPLTVDEANSHIVIQGTAQVRVKPTAIRLIWAVTSEAKDAVACREATQRQITKTKTALLAAGVDGSEITEDFISAIPKFEFLTKNESNETVLVESKTGYLMQTNLHVAVDSHQQAMKVIDAAFASGVTDLIGADYVAELGDAKQSAIKKAVTAAKSKADLVLSGLFDKKPPIINVQEQTKVFYPADMYDSFENVSSQKFFSNYKNSLRRITAYRPQNTYFKGLKRAADQRDYKLAMTPEIVIESKVNLIYRSPAADMPHPPRKDD